MKIYSIRDHKAECFHRPFITMNEQEALRNLYQVAMDKDTLFAHYPQDFALYYLGEFDEKDGKLNPENPVHVTDILNLISSMNREYHRKNSDVVEEVKGEKEVYSNDLYE